MKHTILVAAAAIITAAAGAAGAQSTTQQPAPMQQQGQQGQTKTDIPPALAKQAKITLDSARAIATGRVKNATIESQELEREHGRLIYSFDMRVAGKSGIEEVNVDARTGHVIAVSHEGPADEKKEAAGEKKETTRSGRAH